MPSTAHADADCPSHIEPSGEILWQSTKKGVGKVHFLAPTSSARPSCPGGDGCDLPAFLLGGEQVIVTGYAPTPTSAKHVVCGVYISPKGAVTSGWLDDADLDGGGTGMAEMNEARVYGVWSDRTAVIEIRPGDDEGDSYVSIIGTAAEGTRTGDIRGPAFIGTDRTAGYSPPTFVGRKPATVMPPVDEDVCRVRFRFTGYYLLVDDNDRCGGQGVSFTGVYTK